jgi:hypothetical protein
MLVGLGRSPVSVLSPLGLSDGPGGGADIDFDVCATLAMWAVVRSYVGHHTRTGAIGKANEEDYVVI